LKLNVTHQLLAYADDVNILGGTGQEVNADKSMYTIWSCLNIIMQDELSTKTGNSCFGRVEMFKYLGTTLTNQNSIQEEIKSRLKSGQVQNILSSTLLTKNLNIKIYEIIFLPVVMYGHETWSLSLREERRLRVFENRVLRGILGAEREKR